MLAFALCVYNFHATHTHARARSLTTCRYDNHLFGENVTLADGKKSITLPEFQAMDSAHNDVGSTWTKETPPPATMIEWGRTLLLS